MKYIRIKYRTKGFMHTQLKRREDIYMYSKVSKISGQLVCFEVFKAKKRYPSKGDIIECKLGDHRPPTDEDFGVTAFAIVDETRAWKKFQALVNKHYPQ